MTTESLPLKTCCAVSCQKATLDWNEATEVGARAEASMASKPGAEQDTTNTRGWATMKWKCLGLNLTGAP
eukprot:11181888-Lingulodinium_polyedra.AAC.1